MAASYSSDAAPPARASCSGLTLSALNFFAEASIFASVSSNSALAPRWKRSGLMRATTKARRYGLSKPLLLERLHGGRDGLVELEELRGALARGSRAPSASGLSRNASTRLRIGWYAPPANRPFFS